MHDEANGRGRQSAHDAAGRDDRPGEPREGRSRRRAGLRLHPQPAAAATRIAERVDALAARTLPGLQRSVKWGMACYGVGDGWCFSCGGFAGHVKLTFGHGTSLGPCRRCADRDGQGVAGRGPRFGGRPRRTPGRVVDETSHGHPRLRGEEAISPQRPATSPRRRAAHGVRPRRHQGPIDPPDPRCYVPPTSSPRGAECVGLPPCLGWRWFSSGARLPKTSGSSSSRVLKPAMRVPSPRMMGVCSSQIPSSEQI